MGSHHHKNYGACIGIVHATCSTVKVMFRYIKFDTNSLSALTDAKPSPLKSSSMQPWVDMLCKLKTLKSSDIFLRSAQSNRIALILRYQKWSLILLFHFYLVNMFQLLSPTLARPFAKNQGRNDDQTG